MNIKKNLLKIHEFKILKSDPLLFCYVLASYIVFFTLLNSILNLRFIFEIQLAIFEIIFFQAIFFFASFYASASRGVMKKKFVSACIYFPVSIVIMAMMYSLRAPLGVSLIGVFLAGLILNLVIFKTKITEIGGKFFSSTNDSISSLIFVIGFVFLTMQASDYLVLFNTEKQLWLLFPFIFFSLAAFLRTSKEKRELFLIVAGIFFAIIIYLLQTYGDNSNKRTVIESLNRRSCDTVQKMLFALNNSETGAITYYNLDSEVYKSILGNIIEFKGAEKLNLYLELISTMDYINGLNLTIIDLLNKASYIDPPNSLAAWNSAIKDINQEKNLLHQIEVICPQL